MDSGAGSPCSCTTSTSSTSTLASEPSGVLGSVSDTSTWGSPSWGCCSAPWAVTYPALTNLMKSSIFSPLISAKESSYKNFSNFSVVRYNNLLLSLIGSWIQSLKASYYLSPVLAIPHTYSNLSSQYEVKKSFTIFCSAELSLFISRRIGVWFSRALFSFFEVVGWATLIRIS